MTQCLSAHGKRGENSKKYHFISSNIGFLVEMINTCKVNHQGTWYRKVQGLFYKMAACLATFQSSVTEKQFNDLSAEWKSAQDVWYGGGVRFRRSTFAKVFISLCGLYDTDQTCMLPHRTHPGSCLLERLLLKQIFFFTIVKYSLHARGNYLGTVLQLTFWSNKDPYIMECVF